MLSAVDTGFEDFYPNYTIIHTIDGLYYVKLGGDWYYVDPYTLTSTDQIAQIQFAVLPK